MDDAEAGFAEFDPKPLEAALKGLQGLADDFGRAMTSAFRQSAFEGKRLEDVLKGLALNLSTRALNTALAPIAGGLSNAFAGLFGGKVTPFAQGGVVAAPTYFPLGGGFGLLGEAGPEAVLPLARGADGRLGVAAAGQGRGVSVTMHVTTPDAASFRRAEADVTAMLARAVARGSRGL